MSENMTDIHFAAIEMNRCDQPVFIATNIEDDPMVKFIGGRENLPQFGKGVKLRLLHNFEPTQQCHSAVRMFLPELD
jgi:hypothetical protein